VYGELRDLGHDAVRRYAKAWGVARVAAAEPYVLGDRTIWQASDAEVPVHGQCDGLRATQASVSKTCLMRSQNQTG